MMFIHHMTDVTRCHGSNTSSFAPCGKQNLLWSRVQNLVFGKVQLFGMFCPSALRGSCLLWTVLRSWTFLTVGGSVRFCWVSGQVS